MIQIDASSFAEFEISRFDCICSYVTDVQEIRPSKRTEEAIQQISFDLGAHPEPVGQVNPGVHPGSLDQFNLAANPGSSGQVNRGAPGAINIFPGSDVKIGGQMTVPSGNSSSGAQGTVRLMSQSKRFNFRRYYFYFLPDQAQTHFDHWKVLDELWCKISFKSDNG